MEFGREAAGAMVMAHVAQPDDDFVEGEGRTDLVAEASVGVLPPKCAPQSTKQVCARYSDKLVVDGAAMLAQPVPDEYMQPLPAGQGRTEVLKALQFRRFYVLHDSDRDTTCGAIDADAIQVKHCDRATDRVVHDIDWMAQMQGEAQGCTGNELGGKRSAHWGL